MFENIMFIPQWLMTIFFFIYGSILGSFANVLIYRMQEKGALKLFEKSRCSHCLHPIPFYLNIPILSWFILRGICRHCGKSFSFRYPLVEFLMAFLFSTLFLTIGWKWFLLEALIFAFALIVASFIDWDQMILPDSFTLGGTLIGLLGAFLNPERSFMESLLGALAGGGILLLIALVYYGIRRKEGMGGGDVKMMAWIGSILGYQSLLFVIFFSCFLGSLVGFGIMLQGNKKGLQTALPFGPYLAVASLAFIFLDEWAKAFLSFFMIFSGF